MVVLQFLTLTLNTDKNAHMHKQRNTPN